MGGKRTSNQGRSNSLHSTNKRQQKAENKKGTKGSAFKRSKASTNPHRPDPSGGKPGS